jgi:hypothetical protein
LESFLYVLVHIMFAYDSKGTAHALDETLLDWERHEDNCCEVGFFKEAYLTRRYVPRKVSKRWPSPCVDLIIAYAAFIQPLVQNKLLLNQLTPAARNGREKIFAANSIQHYTHILKLFDTAIEALDCPDKWEVDETSDEDDDGRSDRSDSPPTVIIFDYLAAPAQGPGRTSVKRSSDEDPNGRPPAKRSKSLSGHSSVPPLPCRSSRSRAPSPT